MIRKNRPRSSSLFLMELILAILFFSIASAVCVQFFVKSHLLSQDSNTLNHAANECASVAELLDTAETIDDCISLLNRSYPDGAYPGKSGSNESTEAEIAIYYDESFLPCSAEATVYTLSLSMQRSGQMIIADMEFCNTDSDRLYSLQTKHHVARRTHYESE